jgi:hypothetical protein
MVVQILPGNKKYIHLKEKQHPSSVGLKNAPKLEIKHIFA